jgi:pimeloyl-ACP methyl ester carboxylesterase
MWTEEVCTLGDRVVAPTLYRFGDSIGAWAASALVAAGTDPLIVIGNSVGGSCAIEVACLAPDQVRLLVLIGAKAGHRREPDFRDAALQLLARDGMAAAWPRYWEPLFGTKADPAIVASAREIAFSLDLDDVMRGVRVFHGRPDRTAFVESWPGPILVISGDQDGTPGKGAALAASVRNGEFVSVPDTGHYVPLERPAALTAILREKIRSLV